MSFSLPQYKPPDFVRPPFLEAPTVDFREVMQAGVAPDNYHATSVFPEYYQLRKGEWKLLRDSRMDCVVVLESDGSLDVKEFRHLKKGDLVACGRRENGEDGIYVHANAFDFPNRDIEKFTFRMHPSRETSFSIDYDELYRLLKYEREHGFILWVCGPAVVFDHDARNAFCSLIDAGYVHGLLAGNALAVHDVEVAFFGTALGQEIYSKRHVPFGHYKHLDAINRIMRVGSIQDAISENLVRDGILFSVIRKGIPYVLAGSIRDDGPLPEVTGDAYVAQDMMRAIGKRATTVITLATQLHSIATGNIVPSYTVTSENRVRPVYFYSVDMSEFAVTKLTNRGSLTARFILTNVQDFIATVQRELCTRIE